MSTRTARVRLRGAAKRPTQICHSLQRALQVGLASEGDGRDEGHGDATVGMGAIDEDALGVGQNATEVLLDLLVGPGRLERKGWGGSATSSSVYAHVMPLSIGRKASIEATVRSH